MDDTLRLLQALRSTRYFMPDVVPDRVIDELLDVARWTGSARNRQPWRVAIITTAAERAELARLGAYAAVLELAPVTVLLAIDHQLGGADAEFDAGRFAHALMLAAHTSGLGSCPVTFFPDDNVRTATTFAGLAEPWRVRTAIALGYPDDSPRPMGGRSVIPRGRMSVDALVSRRD